MLVLQSKVFQSWVEPMQRIKCLAQGHNAMQPIRLEPATPRPQVKHSTTELFFMLILAFMPMSMIDSFWQVRETLDLIAIATSACLDEPASSRKTLNCFYTSRTRFRSSTVSFV